MFPCQIICLTFKVLYHTEFLNLQCELVCSLLEYLGNDTYGGFHHGYYNCIVAPVRITAALIFTPPAALMPPSNYYPQGSWKIKHL
jgi:hypothetical protein